MTDNQPDQSRLTGGSSERAEGAVAAAQLPRGATNAGGPVSPDHETVSSRVSSGDPAEALAWLIQPGLHPSAAACVPCENTRRTAARILAAGWRPPLPDVVRVPDSERRGVWQSPDGVHLAVEANDGELEWLECDPVGGWLLRGMLDMVPDEWVRLAPLPDSETESCPAGECNLGMCGGISDSAGPCGGCCGCLGGCLDARREVTS